MTSITDMPSLLRVWRERIFADLRVAFPASVQTFDAQKLTVDVMPLIREQTENESGDLIADRQAVVPAVPVLFPGGGGMRMTWPLQAGDTGLCVVTDRTLDKWLAGQGGEVDQDDPRAHDQSDAVFIPGLKPTGKPWQGAEAGVVTLGSDSGSANFVALANLVKDRLDTIQSAFDGHTHSVPPSLGPDNVVSATPNASIGTIAAVASTTVKIKG